MKRILRIDSSLFEEASVSRQLADELINKLKQQHSNIEIVQRDLAKQPLPHLDASLIQAISTTAEERSPQQQQQANLADQLINEIQIADTLIIGAPMYNFSVPSVLKSWFDYIARAGVTFRYSDSGAEGLLKNKRAYVITSRGGIHKNQPSDSEVPFLRTILNFLGIDDVEFIYAEGLNMSNQREAGLAAAQQQIQQIGA